MEKKFDDAQKFRAPKINLKCKIQKENRRVCVSASDWKENKMENANEINNPIRATTSNRLPRSPSTRPSIYFRQSPSISFSNFMISELKNSKMQILRNVKKTCHGFPFEKFSYLSYSVISDLFNSFLIKNRLTRKNPPIYFAGIFFRYLFQTDFQPKKSCLLA